MKRLAISAALAAVLSAPAAAQTAGQIALLNRGGFYGNAIVAMSTNGAVTSVVPLPAGDLRGIAVHPEGGPDLIVGDTFVYNLKNRVLTTAVAGLPFAARDIVVLEDASWLVAGQTSLLRIPKSGPRTTFASGFGDIASMAWNGSDGSVLLVESTQNRVVVVDPDGTTRSTVAVASPRAAVWNPWTGEMLLAADGALLSLAEDGTLRTLRTGTPGLESPVGMFLKRDGTLFIAQGGNGVTGVYAYRESDAAFLRVVREASGSATGLSPADLTIEHSRDVWPRSAARVGLSVDMQVNFPQYARRSFYGALSLSHKPGLALGSHYVHVTPDALFFRSLVDPTLLQVTPLDSGGNGRLRLFVPNVPAIAGFRVFVAVAVPDAARPAGIGAVSDACGFTIQR